MKQNTIKLKAMLSSPVAIVSEFIPLELHKKEN
jgi:hypothetical protein